MTKSLFATIMGRANTGKSTLMNQILGEKVSIVSSKPQTTRNRINGILTKGETQYVFIDTPGIHKPHDKLGSFMMRTANAASSGIDVILYIAEAGDRIGPIEESIIDKFNQTDIPCVLLVNKTDIHSPKEIGDTILNFSTRFKFDSVIPISAKTGENVQIIFDEIDKYALEGEWFFPDDIITDISESTYISEIIREKILLTMNDEVPHGVAVTIEDMKETPKLLSVRAEIYCEKASHKPMIIGKQGSRIKQIGTMAREDLERFFGIKVFIDLYVRVKENWREDELSVRALGFKQEEIDG